jgi:predicted metalloprotease with PDZ domain
VGRGVKRFSIGVLAALLMATTAQAEPQAKPAPIRYALSPVIEQGALKALAVDIDFEADADGLTVLTFIDRFQNETRPGRYTEGLEVTGAQTVTPRKEGGAEIRSAPGAPLHVRYRVRSGYIAAPTTQDETQTIPVILTDWFYTPGELVFAYVEGRDEAPTTFTWKGGVSGFRFASDLERLTERGGNVADLLDSILIGSPRLRVTEGIGPDARLRIAALGTYDHYDDAAFAKMAFRVIKAERAFWSDRATPFLVTLVPLETRVIEGYSGIGRGDAFALWVGTSLPLGDLRRLLAHEYFHTWNAAQLGRQSAQRRSAWLSEGFTDFYARRLLLRAGLFSLADYAAAWNGDLLAYAVSVARNAPEDEIAKGYWQRQDLADITYKRGALMAALFDADLRRGGKTLDAVMRAMRPLYRRDPDSLLRANFEAAFKTVAGRSPLAEIDRYEMRGETLTLPADAFACLALRTVTQPVRALGFDSDTTAATGVFAGVDPAGPAYASGLRDGMRFVAREGGVPDDSSVESVFRVTDLGGQERVIRYRPEGKTTVSFQKLAVPEGLAAARERACVKTLAGL